MLIKGDQSSAKKEKMRDTLNVLRHFDIPPDLQKEVLAYTHHLLHHSPQSAYQEVIDILPRYLNVVQLVVLLF